MPELAAIYYTSCSQVYEVSTHACQYSNLARFKLCYAGFLIKLTLCNSSLSKCSLIFLLELLRLIQYVFVADSLCWRLYTDLCPLDKSAVLLLVSKMLVFEEELD